MSANKSYSIENSFTNLNTLNDRVATLLSLNEDDMRKKISTGELIIFQNEIAEVFKSYVEEIGEFSS